MNIISKTLMVLPVIAPLFGQAALAKTGAENLPEKKEFTAQNLKKCMLQAIGDLSKENGWANMSRAAMNAHDYTASFETGNYDRTAPEGFNADMMEYKGEAYMALSASKAQNTATVLVQAKTMKRLDVMIEPDDNTAMEEKRALESKAISLFDKVAVCTGINMHIQP